MPTVSPDNELFKRLQNVTTKMQLFGETNEPTKRTALITFIESELTDIVLQLRILYRLRDF